MYALVLVTFVLWPGDKGHIGGGSSMKVGQFLTKKDCLAGMKDFNFASDSKQIIGQEWKVGDDWFLNLRLMCIAQGRSDSAQ
jgi:hypothetical protein